MKHAKSIPPHVEVGMIDVPSDPNNEDKGLAELAKRLIGVTFEHGDNGALGHLRGRVVRYTRSSRDNSD